MVIDDRLVAEDDAIGFELGDALVDFVGGDAEDFGEVFGGGAGILAKKREERIHGIKLGSEHTQGAGMVSGKVLVVVSWRRSVGRRIG